MQKNPSKKFPEKVSSNFIYYFIVAAAAIAVYLNVYSNQFVFDDESVVVGDQSITQLSNIPKYFTAQEGFHKVIGRYYRPVVSATYALDYALWGLKPFGFHLTNVIIHIINSLLFFKLLLLLFPVEKGKSPQARLYAVIFGGLIFAVHPIHTEAVSWVSGRTDSLSFTFFIASFIFYIKYSKSSKPLHFFYLILLYVLALLAKEMAVTLPVVLILYDISEIGGINRELISKKLRIYLILIAVSVLYLFMRWYILKDIPQRETYFYFYGKDIITGVFTMLQTLPLYFRLTLVPVGLLYHYNGYLPYVNSIAASGVIVSLIFLIIMAFLAIYFFRKAPVISFSTVIFFVTLIPVMNIVPTMNFMAERFLYIPSISISIALSVIFLKLYNDKTKQILVILFIVVICIYSYMTLSRNFDWKDNKSLFLSAGDKPGTVTYVNIGNIYANNQEYDKAEVYYRKAIDLRNETLLANVNLGKIFLIRGNFDSSYYYLYKSYQLDTLSPEPMHALAQLYANSNKIPDAISWLERAQKISPNYMNSTEMLQNLKMRQQSGEQLNSTTNDNALKVTGLENDSYQNYQKKNYDKAIKELLELIELNPAGRAGYFNNIGISYLDQNKLEDAKKYFEMAVRENKDFSTAYNNLGSVYEKMGDKEKAKQNYKKAVEADPSNQTAKDNLSKLK